MFLAKMSINRPVMTTMVLSVFLIFGLLAYFTLNLELDPDVEIPYVTIVTTYPGAGPKEIETLISKRLEESASTISQIERIESYSLDGVSIVVIEFKLGKGVDVATQEVKNKVDEIVNDLPDDADLPIVQKVDIKQFPVAEVILSGDLDPRELYEIADKNLKDRFAQIEGVAKVDITGGQEREIRIVLDNRIAYENMISLPQLLQILKAHNMDIPGGYFKIKDQEYTVRLEGEFANAEDIKNLQVPTPFGPKKVQQFARVFDAGKDIRQRAIYFDNKTNTRDENVVRMGIIKSSEGNVVKVADALREVIPEINATLPAGCSLEMVNDESVFVKSSIDDTMSNVYLGVLFTGLVLLLFLHDIRSTLIVALSMPTSIISTFFLLKAFGLTLNMMTLMGLSVSVGVLVANSIVVIENIFRYKGLGKNNKDASYYGTSEVTVAVMAATLTNLVVFLPIVNMSSIVGQWLKELALSAVFATIFSLIMSFTLTPMLASMILPKGTPKKLKIAYWFDRMEEKIVSKYKDILIFSLRTKFRSWMIVTATIVLFLIVMIVFGPRIGFEFMPPFDDGKIRVNIELPEGYNLEETSRVLERIEEKLKKHKEVTHILTDVGKLSNVDVGTNMASMVVQLVDANERTTGIQKMIGNFVEELSDVPNARITVDLASSMGGPGAQIQFYLMGQDLNKLEELKQQIIAKVKDVPGLINFDNSSRAGKPEITVFPKREMLTDASLTVADVALTLRSSIEGIESSKYREFGNEYDITVTLDDKSISSPEDIRNITVVSPVTGAIRLSQIADIKFTTGYTKILHRDKFTSISFTGSPAANYPLGNITSEIDRRLAGIELPAGYAIKWGGNVKMMNEMITDMMFAFFLAALLTYMLLAAILESFWQPVMIMLTVVLGMIGVILSLFISGTSFGITSLMGIIMLIGIVVNNAILILDYTNQLVREQGITPYDALLEACPVKLKPQIMSSVAIILGMLPMALGIGDAGKEMRIPLGVVSIGGLIASTILTIFVIPSFYFVTSKSRLKKEKI